jgi:protein SCO1/2
VRSAAIAFAATFAVATAASAQVNLGGQPKIAPSATEQPEVLRELRVEQKLGSQVDLGLGFVDENGKDVTLASYISQKPVILVMAYYECPMLCTLVLNGVVKALRPLALNPGEDFEVVAVSIDPGETPDLARAKKETYLDSYKRGYHDGFHFLTGEEPQIAALADQIGFGYRYVPEKDEYAHTAAIMVLTPTGVVSNYFYGTEYSTRDLRLALVEASENRIGNVVDEILLYCFRYDPSLGAYSVVALRIMRVGAVLTILGLLGFWTLMRVRHRRSGSATEES